MSNSAPPEGFEPLARKSPMTDPWQPIYACALKDALHLGLWAREPHCNARGFVHGGLYCALADNSMGYSIHQLIQSKGLEGSGRGAVTVGLTLDYLGSAQVGQWVLFESRVLKLGKKLAFTECHIHADGELVARASATFRLG